METLRFRDLLRGWNFAPRLVAIARGIIEAAVLAAIGAASVELTRVDWGEYAMLSPVILFVLRWLEGEADQRIDPQQNRTAEKRAATPPQ